MKSITLANILLAVFLLTTEVSAWYNQKLIKVVQRCTTEYCNQNVHGPKSYTKTIHKTAKTTITVTPKPSTRYIKKNQTKTVTQKHTKTYTVISKCSTRTIHATRTTTVTRTIPYVTTVTSKVVTTITPPATFVPIPSGFLSAGDDPDNQYTLSEEGDLKKRHGKPLYPTSIKCTKTIETIYKHTITAKRRTTTVTKYAKTKTIRQTKKITKTVYQQKPKTTTVTHVSTRTATTTKTSKKVVTKSLTVFAPQFTTWGGCGPHNHFQGPTGSVDVVVLPGDIEVPAEIAYECCAQCHAHLNAQGVPDCAGSYFLGDSVEHKSRCWLRLTDVCSYDHHERFTPSENVPMHRYVGQVGNGPCGRWKVQL
ncbi:hypothetical protein TWF730_004007 [Orbilia blumenaviensis]|uniref:Apple domain-containing protein n=1 Tax=Orbilia blumenaviensis TaxID=1796055 RepID=A0AAV9U404_9PEZI